MVYQLDDDTFRAGTRPASLPVGLEAWLVKGCLQIARPVIGGTHCSFILRGEYWKRDPFTLRRKLPTQ
jgi:hypothetical protein